MNACTLITLFAFSGVNAFSPSTISRRVKFQSLRSTGDSEPQSTLSPAEEAAVEALDQKAADSSTSKQFDLKSKVDGSGAGFNQFDPVLTATQFLSRRFGLAGGLAVVGILAATEGQEILKSLLSTGPTPGTGEVITNPSGLTYEDILIGPATGDFPGPNKIVGFEARVLIGDQVLFDTAGGKPVAFKFGQRPFQNVVCEGLEEGILGMRIGGRRKITVPQGMAPPGVTLPPGVSLVYDVTLTEVLNNYF